MNDATIRVTLTVPANDAELALDALLTLGAEAVEERGGDVLPMPGVENPAPGLAILEAHLPGTTPIESIAALRALFAKVEWIRFTDQSWKTRWRDLFHPMQVSPRLVVSPSWERMPVLPAGTREIEIDPGMAFGTGQHETTQLCLRAVDALCTQSSRVLDVGTGSGILAIAARLLGAREVAGTDNDPDAIRVARENAGKNQVEIDFSETPLDALQGTFDLVLANILAPTLVEMARSIARRLAPGGVCVLAGILLPQADGVIAAYAAAGLPLVQRDEIGEWVCLRHTAAK